MSDSTGIPHGPVFPESFFEAAPTPANAASESPTPEDHVLSSAVCPRCRKEHPTGLPACPYCGRRSKLAITVEQAPMPTGPPVARRLLQMLAAYAVLLGLLLGNAFLIQFVFDRLDVIIVPWMIVFDTLTLIVTGIAWVMTRDVPPSPQPMKSPGMAWAAAFPLLIITLFVNIMYHTLISTFGDLETGTNLMLEAFGSPLWTILLICVAPAICEELFFRGVAWKNLSAVTGPHATILITAVMFGMAHIGVPISIPILILVGVSLGYLRAWSGGLLLPMIFHFLHNLCAIYYAGP